MREFVVGVRVVAVRGFEDGLLHATNGILGPQLRRFGRLESCCGMAHFLPAVDAMAKWPCRMRFAVVKSPRIEGAHERGYTLARQNYGYEKRQKEVARQKKKDAKKQRKLEKNVVPPEETEKQFPDDLTPA